jgi:hypothetical protein
VTSALEVRMQTAFFAQEENQQTGSNPDKQQNPVVEDTSRCLPSVR